MFQAKCFSLDWDSFNYRNLTVNIQWHKYFNSVLMRRGNNLNSIWQLVTRQGTKSSHILIATPEPLCFKFQMQHMQKHNNKVNAFQVTTAKKCSSCYVVWSWLVELQESLLSTVISSAALGSQTHNWPENHKIASQEHIRLCRSILFVQVSYHLHPSLLKKGEKNKFRIRFPY